MKFSLRKGKRYKASIVLGTFERMVSNATLKAELEKVGFSDVKVTGTSSIRYVVAAWQRADQDREIPRQVHEIIEMKPILVEPVKIPLPPDVPAPKPAPPAPQKKPWWKLW
jgi:hypothetical protein